MKKHGKPRCWRLKIFPISLLVIVTLGFLQFMHVDKAMAQFSGNSSNIQGSRAQVSGNSSNSQGSRFTRILEGEGLRFGPLVVHPSLNVEERYTDNAFRSNTNRRSDFIHTISPGIQAQLPFAGLHQAIIDYQGTQTFSQRFSSNNAPRKNLTGQVKFNFPSGFKLRMQGGYTTGFDSRGSAVDVQAAELTKWNATSIIGEVETPGRQLGIRLRVRATDWNFKNNNQGPIRNRLNSRVDLALLRDITPKTSALLNIGVTRQAFDQNTQLDSVNYRISTGLRWKATGKINGEIQVGYAFLNFDHAPVTQPAGSLLSSGSTKRQNLRISGMINWAATARSRIRFRPFRSVRQSGISNTSTFTQSGLSINASHAIGIRTTLRGDFRYSHNDFENDAGNQALEKRIDQQLRGGFGVTYQAIKWVGVSGRYQYAQRFSSFERNEFYANTLMVSIQGVF